MKTSTISQYITRRQQRLYGVIISGIFLLTAAMLLLSTYYRIEHNVAREQRDVVYYTEQFFASYQGRNDSYNQNQAIRNLLRYAADNPDVDAGTTVFGLNLPSDVAFYAEGKLVYTAGQESGFPSRFSQEIDRETLVYTDALYYLVPYYNFTQSRQLGLVCYRIQPINLADYFSATPVAQNPFALYDSQGSSFYQTNGDITGLSGYSFDSPEQLFGGMVYIDLHGYYNSSILFLFILFLGCAAGILCNNYFARRLARQIAGPLNQFIASLKHNQQGELSYMPVAVSDLEEINQLSAAYEEMLYKIRLLVEQNQKQNLLKAESELKVLQERINPHFLFNTLELISSQAILEDADDTARMAQKLGALFRYSLRMPDIIYLSQEIQYARDYLFLQNVRYNNRIHYQIDVPEKFAQFLIPKLTLQPVLENCFKHGFSDGTDCDHQIRILAEIQDSFLVLTVWDDGCGIPPDHVRALKEDMARDVSDFSHFIDRNEHIGLRNVNARLCSYYAVGAAVDLAPGSAGGTEVTIRLPYTQKNTGEGGPFSYV